MRDNNTSISCTSEELKQLKKIATSRTVGIWRIKRAKIILGALEGRSVDRLVYDVRVPPNSVQKCMTEFAYQRIQYFETPQRRPTDREARIEKMLDFLENPPSSHSKKWDVTTVVYIGHEITARQVKKNREVIESNPTLNRSQIAAQVFHMLSAKKSDKVSNNGAWIPDILKRMDMDNVIQLPCVPFKEFKTATPKVQSIRTKREKIYLDQQDLRTLQFIPVKSKKDSDLWRDVILDYHYIGRHRLFGAQMKYLVYGGKNIEKPTNHTENPAQKKLIKCYPENGNNNNSDSARGEHLVAVLGFSAGSWQLSSRDRFIGWTDEQRTSNLKYVVNNARFLVLPWIQSPNLASRILGGIVRQLPIDWEARYGYKPVLLETFVLLDKYKGTCYRAANWRQVGTTKGYSLYGGKQRKMIPNKGIFVYPLRKDFRKVLCDG